MKFKELEKEYFKIDGETFTPRTICEIKIDQNGDKYGEHTITKTAKEVYNEYLSKK
ncbi:MAG: hypothetical protein [Bacteriophage sp.]|nr:MAG: hypothetical protein [Bacteriophage sp.]UWG92203.1 MAG: hypothetical protein [Bacteriophage sp.]